MLTVTRDPEVHLMDMVTSLREDGQGWTAIEFRFSQLLEHYRSDYQIKIAVNLIFDLLKSLQGNIYIFNDSTIMLLCRDMGEVLREKTVFQLRYLFMDDPLSYNADGQENENFCRIYSVAREYSDLLAFAKQRVAMLSKVVKDALRQPVAAGEAQAGALSSLLRNLNKVDMPSVLRRQPVCALLNGAGMKTVFEEVYVNIQHLRTQLQSDSDVFANRWLFKYLTQLLDVRMLDHMRSHVAERSVAAPFSINLNISTLLSRDFTEFDRALRPSAKMGVVIEVHAADVFDDIRGYQTAREVVHKLGYRVCLDGLTPMTFAQVDREILGFDLIKLLWDADGESDLSTRTNQKLSAAVRMFGANRVVLCRCDNRQAIEYGRALGISLFQGRYIDTQIFPNLLVVN